MYSLRTIVSGARTTLGKCKSTVKAMEVVTAFIAGVVCLLSVDAGSQLSSIAGLNWLFTQAA